MSALGIRTVVVLAPAKLIQLDGSSHKKTMHIIHNHCYAIIYYSKNSFTENDLYEQVNQDSRVNV